MGKTVFRSEGNFKSCQNRVLVLAAFCGVLFLSGCQSRSQETHILFTGDILLSRNVLVEIEQHRGSPWQHLEALFRSADLVVGNLEGAVGEAAERATDGSPVFDIPVNSLPLLHNAGFDMLSVENNHSADLGDSGKTKTINELWNAGITSVSYDLSPRYITVNDVTIAIVAINLVPDRQGMHHSIPSLGIRQKLWVANSLANMVVVFIHWGSELLDWPNDNQRRAAKWLVGNGADLIIGSHPHVIQKPEQVDGKPVFFSLGNHLFDQKYPRTKEGLMVDCRIRNGEFICKGIITHTAPNSFFPEVVHGEEYDFEPVPLRSGMNISGVDIKAGSMQSVSENRTVLNGFRDGKQLWQTHPMSIVTAAVSTLDGEKDYLLTLEKQYSRIDKETNVRPYVYTVTNDGLVARWRGSALAWPLLDVAISPQDSRVLCALHRGDSYIKLNPHTKATRVAAYKWNGFGFSGVEDSVICEDCRKRMDVNAY